MKEVNTMKLLLVIDMQNDFITGPNLGTPYVQQLVPKVVEKINGWTDRIIVTRDTHGEDYLNTQEGRLCPIVHAIEGTEGWQVEPAVQAALDAKGDKVSYLNKHCFGSRELGEELLRIHAQAPIEEVQFVGICTDVCVISNVMIAKAFLPEVPVIVDAACCAGVTPEGHAAALTAMKPCQVIVVNE